MHAWYYVFNFLIISSSGSLLVKYLLWENTAIIRWPPRRVTALQLWEDRFSVPDLVSSPPLAADASYQKDHGLGDCPVCRVAPYINILSWKIVFKYPIQAGLQDIRNKVEWLVLFVVRNSYRFFEKRRLNRVQWAHLQEVISRHTTNQGLKDMTNTLIRLWKANTNVLFVFWGCENRYRLPADTDSVKAAFYVQ